MKRTKEQNRRLFGLLNALHLTEEERGVLVGSFTDGRVVSSKDMTVVECQALIEHLQRQYDGSIKKMRAKAINIALDIGVLKPHPLPPPLQGGGEKKAYVESWEPMNKWTLGKWKQPFYKLDYDQLRNCITALERWRDGETDKALKEILG